MFLDSLKTLCLGVSKLDTPNFFVKILDFWRPKVYNIIVAREQQERS